MSSLSKASSDSYFETAISNLAVTNITTKAPLGTITLNSLAIAADGEAVINDAGLQVGKAIQGDLYIQGAYSRPGNAHDLINQPSWYRAYGNVCLYSKALEIESAALANLDIYPSDNSGNALPISAFGTNVKLDIDVSCTPGNANNFIEIQVINQADVAIVAGYYTKKDKNFTTATGALNVSSWQLSNGLAVKCYQSMNLVFNFYAVGNSGRSLWSGTNTVIKDSDSSITRMSYTGFVNNLGSDTISKIRLRVSNNNHTGYFIRARLYSVC